MTIIENLYRIHSHELFEKNYWNPIKVKDTVSKIAKKTFRYLYQNRYTFSVIAWTSLLIEVGATASSIGFPQVLNNLENCTEAFCFYFNKTDIHPSSFFHSPSCGEKPEVEVFPSLESCKNNLIAFYFYYKKTYWEKICPSIDIDYLENNLTKHMRQCFGRLCLGDNFINLMNEKVFDWCPLKEITDSKKVLRSLTEKIIPIETTEWNREDILDMMIAFFVDLTKEAQSLLALIISHEKLLSPPTLPVAQDFDLIIKGMQKVMLTSIHLVKEILTLESNENYLKFTEILETVLEKLAKILFPQQNV